MKDSSPQAVLARDIRTAAVVAKVLIAVAVLSLALTAAWALQ